MKKQYNLLFLALLLLLVSSHSCEVRFSEASPIASGNGVVTDQKWTSELAATLSQPSDNLDALNQLQNKETGQEAGRAYPNGILAAARLKTPQVTEFELQPALIPEYQTGAVTLLGESAALPKQAIEGTNWFPIGPAPIQGFFPGGVTGRASAIAVNPENPDDIWLGTAAGGVWHSTDGGQNWTPMSDREEALAIGALALANCTSEGCDRIYAGTGENAIRRDTYYGSGLLIGGLTGGEFSRFEWTLRDGSPDFDFRGGSINNVVLDPTTSGASTRLYITLSSGVTVSATEATVTAPEPSPGGYGIYQSENDGSTWIKLTIAGAEGDKPTDLEMDPTDSNLLYAGFLSSGVFKGIRNPGDGSITWCPVNEGVPKPPGCPNPVGLPDPATTTFDHVEIAIFPGDSSVLYALFGQCPDQLLQNCVPSLYKSTDGGLNWEQKLAGNPNHGSSLGTARVYSRYTHGLTVHPTSQETVFLGGIKLWKSTDSGQNFSASDTNIAPGTSSWGPIVHLDHHAVVIHPTNPDRMYSTSDGGFAYSTNGGNSWSPGNDDLQITGFQSIASSPLTGAVLGASQDNSAQLWTGSRVWDLKPCCGDGGFTIMDFDDVLTMYAGHNFGTPKRSTDGGVIWQTITNGIPSSDPRLFYAPAVQDPSPPHPLYFGTNRLFRGTTDGSSWSAVSPVLSTTPQPEIVTASSTTDHIASGGVNVITAIAVAPSNPNRIYIGYYGGEIFVTDAPCPDVSCWTPVGGSLPDAPVTRIAVHPTQPNTAYVTLSGFGSFAHVWKTESGGSSWNPIVIGLPAAVPANTISIEPSTPSHLWLGLDSGPDGSSLYKSTDGGDNWVAFSSGLPNAPVYEISIDETHGRVYAATHGRGAFVLSKPFLSNFEGWVDDEIWDVPVYGQNFLPPDETCTMQILQSTGDVCAQGSVDAMGGTIQTEDGVLVTSKGSFYSGKPVAWACFNGNCLDDTPIAECNDDENGDGIPDPLTTVLVSCGGELAIDNVLGCPPLANPPSTLLDLGLLGFSGLKASAQDASFVLIPSVQARNDTRSLCAVSVPFQPGESTEQVLTRARDAVNTSPTCAANTVSALLEGEGDVGEEDEFARTPRLGITAPGVTGGQLITALRAAPGQATGTCFVVSGLGVPVLNQLRVMKLKFETETGGAAGGNNITLLERSGLGTCSITVPTSAGQSAGDIAQTLEDAFQAPGIPGPNPDCPAEWNLRDVVADGDSLITVFASDIEVCITDPNVGFTLIPEELALVGEADLGISKSVSLPTASPIAMTISDYRVYLPMIAKEGTGTSINITVSTTEGKLITVDVLTDEINANETLDPNNLNVIIEPSNGSVINNSDGTFDYTPDPGFTGGDSFAVQICNASGPCTLIVVTVDVIAALPGDKDDSSVTAIAGTEIIYTIDVTNEGPDDAEAIQVVDSLPAGVNYLSDNAGCVEVPTGTLTCDLGAIPNGGSQQIVISALIDADLVYDAGGPTTITNSASVEDLIIPDPDLNNNESSVDTQVVAAADLEIVDFTAVDPPEQILVGESVEVIVRKTIDNNGLSAPMDVFLNDTALAPPDSTVIPTEIDRIEVGLGLGEARVIEETYTIQCNSFSHHDFTFTTSIQPLNAEDSDPDLSNNEAELTLDIECVVPVKIEVKPKQINLRGNGVVPVLLLSNEAGEFGLPLAFNASMIDPLSVRFGPPEIVWSETGGATESHEQAHGHGQGVMFHFQAVESDLTTEDTQACLKGTWFDSDSNPHSFFGCTEVVVLGKK